jgi:hypothetical protein
MVLSSQSIPFAEISTTMSDDAIPSAEQLTAMNNELAESFAL